MISTNSRISSLPSLHGGTIASLEEHGYSTVEDLINLDMNALLEIDEIPCTERDKVEAIRDFLIGR